MSHSGEDVPRLPIPFDDVYDKVMIQDLERQLMEKVGELDELQKTYQKNTNEDLRTYTQLLLQFKELTEENDRLRENLKNLSRYGYERS